MKATKSRIAVTAVIVFQTENLGLINRIQNAFLKHSNNHYCDLNWKSGCLQKNDFIYTIHKITP